MEYLDEIPYGETEQMHWAEIFGPAVAKVHALNMGVKPSWLLGLNAYNPAGDIFTDEWLDQLSKFFEADKEFAAAYGYLQDDIMRSWKFFNKALYRTFALPKIPLA